MNLSFVNGTARQQDWVKEAVSQCSYPLGKLNADVSVRWADPLPPNDAGKLHAYMVTNKRDDGSFVVSIASWADDPGRNPGLPDPANDTFDFYKSSFIHELGHVVAMSTFAITDAAADVAKVCELFWTGRTSDGSPRRQGGASDWDASALAWVEQIREAFAEVFKVAFYKGREIFLNRTQWNIDEADFKSLLRYIPKTAAGEIVPITYDSLIDTDPANYIQPSQINGSDLINADGPPLISGGHFTVNTSQSSPPTTIKPTLIYAKNWPLLFLEGFDWFSTIKIDELPLNIDGAYNPPPQLGFVDAFGDPHFPPPSIYETDSLQTTALTTPGSAPPAPSGFPYWVRLFAHLVSNQFFISNYDSDPNGPGGAAAIETAVWTPNRPAILGTPRPCLLMYGADVFDDVGRTVIGEWRVDTYVQLRTESPSADYPFGGPGKILGGPAAQGTILIGTAR